MITYQKLQVVASKFSGVKLTIKPIYFVITIPKTKYHVTIYQDQWDDYETITGLPYYLFHISSSDHTDEEVNRCSTYFWVDKKNNLITRIQDKYFQYEQLDFGFYSSRRKPCDQKKILICLVLFQKILNTASKKLINNFG